MTLDKTKLLELRTFFDNQLAELIDELGTITIIPEHMEHLRSVLNEITICMNQNEKNTAILDRMPVETGNPNE